VLAGESVNDSDRREREREVRGWQGVGEERRRANKEGGT
jgi:hypothetical protein